MRVANWRKCAGKSVPLYHIHLQLQVAKCGFMDPDDVIPRKILQTMRHKKLNHEEIVKKYTLPQYKQGQTKA